MENNDKVCELGFCYEHDEEDCPECTASTVPNKEPTKEWTDGFRKKWLGANICYGCSGGCAISTQMMEEMANDISQAIQQALSAREEELVEKVKELPWLQNNAGVKEIEEEVSYVEADKVIALIKGDR